MSKIEENYNPEYLHKELTLPLTQKPNVVRVKAYAPDHLNDRNGSSHWMNIPANVWRSMLDVVRPKDMPKALPQTFMGGEVIMTARIPVKPGLAPHQAVIVREYMDQGQTLYSTHYLIAERSTDAWHENLSEYDIPTREEAFDDFCERMYRRGGLSRDRKVRD